MNYCDTCKNEPYKNGVGGPCAECVDHAGWIEITPVEQAPEADDTEHVRNAVRDVILRHVEPGTGALDSQVGGSHYKDMTIQPIEFIHRNGIGFAEGCAIKYLCRWRKKNGVEDLRKARHFIDLLIEMESAAP